jgi:hypothetical protein
MWLSRFRLGWFRLWSIWLSQVAVAVEVQQAVLVLAAVVVLAVS